MYLGIDFSYKDPFKSLKHFDYGDHRPESHETREWRFTRIQESIKEQALRIRHLREITRLDDDFRIPRTSKTESEFQNVLQLKKRKWRIVRRRKETPPHKMKMRSKRIKRERMR